MNNWRSINYSGEYSNQSNFQSKQIIISARECLKFISECKVINIVMEILYTHQHHRHYKQTPVCIFLFILEKWISTARADVYHPMSVGSLISKDVQFCSVIHGTVRATELTSSIITKLFSFNQENLVTRISNLCWNVIRRFDN